MATQVADKSECITCTHHKVLNLRHIIDGKPVKQCDIGEHPDYCRGKTNRKNPECHYLKKRPAGDETYYWCDLSDHPCMREYGGNECEEYNEFLEEQKNDKETSTSDYLSSIVPGL